MRAGESLRAKDVIQLLMGAPGTMAMSHHLHWLVTWDQMPLLGILLGWRRQNGMTAGLLSHACSIKHFLQVVSKGFG